MNHKHWNINGDIYIYSICSCWWNVVTYKWKVHNEKIEIISFVVKFSYRPSLSISRCRSKQEADLAVSVVSFISSSMSNANWDTIFSFLEILINNDNQIRLFPMIHLKLSYQVFLLVNVVLQNLDNAFLLIHTCKWDDRHRVLKDR